MKSEVIITDGHWRKSLAAVRALGKKGIKTAVGESTRVATSMFSKYCRRAFVYPSPVHRPLEFIDFMENVLRRGNCQMFLPMEDETLVLISENHSIFSRWTYLPFVSADKLAFARSKDRVLQLAETKGIPIPKTWYIESLAQLDELIDGLPYPVVIKPKTGSGALGVSYIQKKQDLKKRYLSIHRQYPYPLIQERIPAEGAGYGVSLLFDENSTVKASFVHKRLREYPVSGGASTFRESVQNDEIRDMAVSLLKDLGWFGVAMVEFKQDPRDGVLKLMEINPRFWGSLSLAIASGVNFPYLLYKMSKGERFKPVENYKIGVKCRWLLPGDLLHFIYNPNRVRLIPEFFNFTDPDTHYDILSLDDPLPVLGRALTLLTFLYDRDIKHRMRMRKI
ncbi:MAG: ATP-grasp domain-containing protein [Deltaproteobacteria bacterium]|nr:ATP-grasp domain-containing protein [Deltaproteobacteria bacterium]